MITFKRSTIGIAIGFCSLALLSPALTAAAPRPLISSPTITGFYPTGFYVGGFGGWASFNKSGVTQSGIAFFPPNSDLGFPLPVSARGSIDNNSVGFGGIHFGYEWPTPYYSQPRYPRYKDDVVAAPTWAIVPAVELEGFYLNDTEEGRVFNPNPRLPNHRFRDTFSDATGVILVNWVMSLDYPQISTIVHPYIGVGLGAAVRSISDADSLQTSPLEANVNHFNSDPNDTDWTFAAQAKLGLRFTLTDYCRLFAEYRVIYFGNTDYTFGATRYPTHVETSSWTVNLNNRYANSVAAGIDFTL